MNPTHPLTVSEQETARRQATRALRKRLELRRPHPDDYTAAAESPIAARMVANILHGSRVGIVLVAVAMLAASAIRNFVAVYENYLQSGTADPIAALAGALFIVGVEGALFMLALDQEGRNMRRRAERAPRRVFTLADLAHAAKVRLGLAPPRPYHELAQHDGLGAVIGMAFLFACIANIGVAMKAEFTQSGLPLLDYVVSLAHRPIAEQWRVVETLAIALLPPSVALLAGHITARNAAAYAEQSEQAKARYEADLRAWREEWNDPLATDEGTEYLEALLHEKAQRKHARHTVKHLPPPDNGRAPFEETPAR